jgi:hypothetical protein
MKDEAKKAWIKCDVLQIRTGWRERAPRWALEFNELYAREGMKSQSCRTLEG